MKIIFLFLITILYLNFHLEASMRCGDAVDRDHIDLASRYPVVPFVGPSGFYGSGTIVHSSAFCAKVPPFFFVLTCAHICGTFPDNRGTVLYSDGKQYSGKFFVHHQFQRSQDLSLPTVPDSDAFDIAVFISETPLPELSGAPVYLGSLDGLRRNLLTGVGFGLTGHWSGNHQVMDGRKRASHAMASNDNWTDLPDSTTVTKTQTTTNPSGDEITQNVEPAPPGHCLSVTVCHPDTSESCSSLAGVFNSGDSGGGVFNSKGELAGVISGSGPTYNLPKSDERVLVVWGPYMKGYPNIQKLFSQRALEKSDPTTCPPPIITDDLTPYLITPSALPFADALKCATGVFTVIAPHRAWIESVLMAQIGNP